MAAPTRSRYPAGALDWLVPRQRSRVLDLAHGSTAFAAELSSRHHRVLVLDREPPAGGPGPGVVGQPENLPFLAQRFDAVTAVDTLTRFAPGLALPEAARVLHPDGRLAVLLTTRDDTVPWVRRLARLVQQVDPEAMQGDFGQQAAESIAGSGAFTAVERRDFRHWLPCTREALVSMVSRRPVVAASPDRDQLLADVAGLYGSVARPPEPLMLPFQASCWRARPVPAEHQEEDDALSITL